MDAPERTHYADEDTLAYIAKLEQESARLRETVSGHARAILECEERILDLLEWCRALVEEGE